MSSAGPVCDFHPDLDNLYTNNKCLKKFHCTSKFSARHLADGQHGLLSPGPPDSETDGAIGEVLDGMETLSWGVNPGTPPGRTDTGAGRTSPVSSGAEVSRDP